MIIVSKICINPPGRNSITINIIVINSTDFIVKQKINPHIKLSKAITNLINLAEEGRIEECYKLMSEIVPE